MNTYEFSLVFALPSSQSDPEEHLDALFEAGCDDALIGTGVLGRIALDFERKGNNALSTILSAIDDVKRAIPNADVAECSPDLVGVTGIASLFQLSRQAVQKAIKSNLNSFPTPVHSGNSNVWHLSQIVDWAQAHRKLTSQIKNFSIVSETAKATRQLNLAKELQSVGGSIDPEVMQAFHINYSDLERRVH